MAVQKKKKLNLYDLMTKGNGKGVSKEEKNHPRNFKYFFKMLKNNLTRLMYVNFYLVFGNFPLVFAILAFAYTLKETPAPSTAAFSQLYGALRNNGQSLFSGAAQAAMYGVHGMRSIMTSPTTLTYVFLGLSLLVVFTSGLVNVGTTYILRNIVKGDPVFMWTDFWYAIKRNIKQGLIMGLLDVVFTLMFAYNIYIMYPNSSSYIYGLIFYGNVLLLLIYFVMRFYSYILIVTFDLSILKILKNSLIFSILGIKRNLLSLLGIAFTALIEFAIFILFKPLALILPFFLVFGIIRFMEIYAAFPKIKQIMIDPYYPDDEDEAKEDPICKDVG